MQKTDILVVGGCTAGLYFAALMARAGFDVVVIDKASEQQIGSRYDIFHLGQDNFERFGVPQPQPGDEDYVGLFTSSISKSALDNHPKTSHQDVCVLHRQPFIRRMAAWAKENGAKVLYNTAFEGLLFDSQDKICGATVSFNGKTDTVYARLVADCSGIPSVVRTALPDGYGVENFAITPRDQFYVVLQYAKLQNPAQDKPSGSCGWPYYKTWIAPQQDPDGVILGIGASFSFEYAQKCFDRFAAAVPLPPHTLQHTEKSSTPYRRPPYSFVADGFVALGDAACITNPWSGEGVPYAWLQCQIAAEEFIAAMKGGTRPVIDSVWEANARYARAQGAMFAQSLALLSAATDCTPQENDYEFANSIFFESDDEPETGSIVPKLLTGLLTGKLKPRTLKILAQAASAANKLGKHYAEFPTEREQYPAWKAKADTLWAKTRSMADVAQTD